MMLRSNNAPVYRSINGRLAQYKVWTNTFTDWDEIWTERNTAKILSKKITDLGEIDFIKKFLPSNKKILEAGCGNGWVVQALTLSGFDVEGIDYAEKTISQIKQAAPDLDVRVGDIYAIDRPDDYYGAYLSLGVLEHNIDGPDKGLREAYRVLQPGGIGIVTIPYLNQTRNVVLRNLKNGIIQPDSLQFYQYYFSKSEFTSILQRAGFEVLDIIPIGLYYGLNADSPIFRFLDKRNYVHWRIKSWFYTICQAANANLRWKWGHMLACICSKKNC